MRTFRMRTSAAPVYRSAVGQLAILNVAKSAGSGMLKRNILPR